jgi:hypothetical protein
MIVALFATGCGSPPGCCGQFVTMLLLYVVITTSYSFWLKRSCCSTCSSSPASTRIACSPGGQAAEVEVSRWLLAFCIFFFLSLAFAKRYAELLRVQEEDCGKQIRGRAYRVEDLDIMNSVGPASGYMSVLVLALYVNQSDLGAGAYRSPSMLWLLCPVMLYWITRVWFLAPAASLTEDPILFAMKDRVSLMTVGVCCCCWCWRRRRAGRRSGDGPSGSSPAPAAIRDPLEALPRHCGRRIAATSGKNSARFSRVTPHSPNSLHARRVDHRAAELQHVPPRRRGRVPALAGVAGDRADAQVEARLNRPRQAALADAAVPGEHRRLVAEQIRDRRPGRFASTLVSTRRRRAWR